MVHARSHLWLQIDDYDDYDACSILSPVIVHFRIRIRVRVRVRVRARMRVIQGSESWPYSKQFCDTGLESGSEMELRLG